jgi:hypothetical protein
VPLENDNPLCGQRGAVHVASEKDYMALIIYPQPEPSRRMRVFYFKLNGSLNRDLLKLKRFL